MLDKKLLTSKQAFQLCCSFLFEIYDSCSEIYNSEPSHDNGYPVLQTSVLTDEQFKRLDMFASQMNWHPDWNIEWQEAIIRLNYCKSIDEIDKKTFSCDDTLIIASEMLAFKVIYWKFDFIPVLAVIKKVLQRDKRYKLAIDMWDNQIKIFNENPDHSNFSFYAYSSDITKGIHFNRKEIFYLNEQQRFEIEKRVFDYIAESHKPKASSSYGLDD